MPPSSMMCVFLSVFSKRTAFILSKMMNQPAVLGVSACRSSSKCAGRITVVLEDKAKNNDGLLHCFTLKLVCFRRLIGERKVSEGLLKRPRSFNSTLILRRSALQEKSWKGGWTLTLNWAPTCGKDKHITKYSKLVEFGIEKKNESVITRQALLTRKNNKQNYKNKRGNYTFLRNVPRT